MVRWERYRRSLSRETIVALYEFIDSAHLIFRQARLPFGILQGALHPIPLALHHSQTLDRCVVRRIAQAVFVSRLVFTLVAHEEMPLPRLLFLAIP